MTTLVKYADYHIKDEKRKDMVDRETFDLNELHFIKYVMKHWHTISEQARKTGKVIIEIETPIDQ